MTAPKKPEEKQKPGPKPKPKAQGELSYVFDGLMFRDTPELIFIKLFDSHGEVMYVGAYRLPEGILLPENGVAYKTKEEVEQYQRLYVQQKRRMLSLNQIALPRKQPLIVPDHSIIVDADKD